MTPLISLFFLPYTCPACSLYACSQPAPSDLSAHSSLPVRSVFFQPAPAFLLCSHHDGARLVKSFLFNHFTLPTLLLLLDLNSLSGLPPLLNNMFTLPNLPILLDLTYKCLYLEHPAFDDPPRLLPIRTISPSAARGAETGGWSSSIPPSAATRRTEGVDTSIKTPHTLSPPV
jgi:hypothetical protein